MASSITLRFIPRNVYKLAQRRQQKELNEKDKRINLGLSFILLIKEAYARDLTEINKEIEHLQKCKEL